MLVQNLTHLLIFSGLVLVSFYALGFGIIQRLRLKLTGVETLTLSLSLGMIIFILQGVAFGLLGIRQGLLATTILFGTLCIYKYRSSLITPWISLFKDKLLLSLVLICILVQGFINFPSGYLYDGDLRFWSAQGHDGLWHVAVIEQVAKNFPPNNPIYAGEKLYNYHYLVDVLIGEWLRIYPFFSSLDLYFRFFPVLFSLLITLAVFAFVNRWQEDRNIAYLAIFFTNLVGSFGYVVTFLKHQRLFAGETVFWASQINTILGNPPHALSFTLLINFLLAFTFYLRSRQRSWLVICIVLGLMISGIKVSAGIVLLSGLTVAAFADLIFNKKKMTLLLWLILGITNFITVKAMTKEVGSFLIFLPWWFIRTMVVSGDRLDWIDLEFRRQHYITRGTLKGLLRVVELETYAFLIFFIGNLGTRIIGILEIIRRVMFRFRTYLVDPIELLLLGIMFTGFMIPLLFVQKGVAYNTIQFFQYFLLIFGFYGAISFYRMLQLIKPKIGRMLLVIFLIAVSLPTVVGNLVEFYGPGTSPLAQVNKGELEALGYLKSNADPASIVLNKTFNRELMYKFLVPPKPMYAWYPTPYISALTGLTTYLSSSEQVAILGYPLEDRVKNVDNFFSQKDYMWNRQFLKEQGIDYIYLPRGEELSTQLDLLENNLDIYFENSEVIIYSVKS